ncbi:cation diffusion facilitator family transporter [Salinithrix halophila]|uniref:Cation diffusion facilitator family transporter n=1 Tax=Salinithrix halophila TaxID=1485204 RepID=A0ABV8JBU8_9BACL
MHHHHGHGNSPHSLGRQRQQNRMGLSIALGITFGIMLLEFIGGLLTNSLALLADSGHMLSDTGSIALSLVAMWYATKPSSPRKTYGYFRFEILAALFNAVTLFVIAGFIVREAIARFLEPPKVAGGSMMMIAAIGLVANIASAFFLMRKGDVKENVNLRSAYLHILGDALGSVGAIVAGLLMMLFSWYVADPIISVLVALLILRSAWGVLRQSIHILMEGTPITVDQQKVEDSLKAIPGVIDVHDLHIWTITSGLDSLACHLWVSEESDEQHILQEAIRRVEEEFQIRHTTIQVEKSQLQHMDCEF